MRRVRIWLYLGAVAALLMGGCGGNDSKDAVVSTGAFPFGLSTSDATFDLDNDGANEELASAGFTYDAAGRVAGFRREVQFDGDGNGIMDYAETISLKLNPNIAFDPENFGFDSQSLTAAVAAQAIPSSPTLLKTSKSYIPEELLMIASLAKAAPVEIKMERHFLHSYLALSTPEALLLVARMTATFSYNAQDQLVELTQLEESNSGSDQFNVSYAYDSQGNPSKIVVTGDYNSDGWLEYKQILNYASTYDAAGNLTQMVLTNPAETRVEQTEWTYNEAGRKLSETRNIDNEGEGTWDEGSGTTWSYDEAGRLATKVESYGLPLVVTGTTTYDYDTAGRLTAYRESNPGETEIDGETFSYSEEGQFVSHTREYTSVDYGWQETYTFNYDEGGSLAGYTFEEDWNNDGTADRQEVAVATIDGSRVAFAAEMFNWESGAPVLMGKRSFDLVFLAGLPTAAMEWPLEESGEVRASVPAVPAYVMMSEWLYQGMVK